VSQTKRQKENERFAKMCDAIGGENSQGGRELRATNRRIEKRKRQQFRKQTNG
jgi:hypothetical protein